ncbi:LexA family transcriptional regulator [Novispirillum itersonii]|uniref:LexA family transcriptional regulator n=1 Tax=Novispirillum itersonii TaxID=189 RepID=UPI0003677CFE|nr:S24 family peptidase [Novispirillum itersonii]
MTLIDTLKKALQAPGKSQRGLARAMGLDPAAINRMLKGERQIKAHELAAIRDYLGLPASDDLSPAPPGEQGGEQAGPPPHRQGAATLSGFAAPHGLPPWRQPPSLTDEFAMVPVYEARAAAGDGAVNPETAPVCFSAFRWEWLRRVTQAPTEQLAVIQVSGDSMEPTLHHGDHVLIDRTVTRWTRDGLYVIRYAISDELMVKRLIWAPSSRTFSIRSDNPAYGNTDGVGPEDLAVIGRVLWLGRNIG